MATRSIRRSGLEWSQVRVGAVLLVALLALTYAIISVGKMLNMFNKRYEIITLLPTAAGLPKGAQVTLAGQRIGTITAIEFIPIQKKKQGNNILVRMAVSKDVQEQIRRDSKVQLRTQGLLGDKYIDISPGSSGAAIMQQNDTLAAMPPVDFDQLLANAADALGSAQAAIGQVRTMTTNVSRGEGTLGHFVSDDQLYVSMLGSTSELHTMLHQINTSEGTFGKLVRDPSMYRRLDSAVGRMDSLTALALHGNGTIGKFLRDDSIYRGLAATISKADQTLTGFSALADKFSTGQGTFQRLAQDPALYDQLLKSVVDVQTLINDIRQNPKKYQPNIDVNILSKVNKQAAPGDTTKKK